MATTRRSRPSRVHGPCEGCGALYYTMQTTNPAVCPNCGYQPTSAD